MTTELRLLRHFQSNETAMMAVLGLFYLLIIANRIVASNIYNNAMPSDLFSLLDGAYRIHSGEIIHRDFSSPLGLFAYALPATFMLFGAELIRSVSYSEAVFAAVAFLIFIYMQRTRLDAMSGFFLGVWIPLALLARMNFGVAPEFYTEAMQYNRRCDVFLLLLLLLSIPPFTPTKRFLVIDGVLFGAIAALLFYTKITFGLVALGAAPLFFLRRRENLIVIAVGAITFMGLAACVEFGYGIKFAWVADILMAAHAVRANHLRILHIWRDNGLELSFLLAIPAFILFGLKRLTIPILSFCLYIAVASALLLAYSAQYLLLTLPIAFLFVALDASKPRADEAGEVIAANTSETSNPQARYALFSALVSCVVLIESYPLALNVGTSTFRGLHGAPLDSGNEVLSRIVTDGASDEADPYSVWVRNVQANEGSPIDAFAMGRATKPRHYWDSLSMREFADYLTTGISAIHKGCDDHARIANLDWGNPFSLLLGWPEGGGMTYVAVGYVVSKDAHLPNEVMFRDVNCVMIPKLPAIMASRDLLLNIYGPFLST